MIPFRKSLIFIFKRCLSHFSNFSEKKRKSYQLSLLSGPPHEGVVIPNVKLSENLPSIRLDPEAAE